VTTGDALGDHVLYRLNDPGSLTGNDHLGIFKIPHHGSRYNSLIDKSYQPSDPYKEKLHYLWLALTARYAYYRMDQGQDMDLVGTVFIAVTDNHHEAWMADNIPRSSSGFEAILGDLSDRFRRFIAEQKFVYYDHDSGTELNLEEDADLIAFVVLLARRYSDILAAAYADLPDQVRHEQARTYIGKLTPKFDLANFKKYPYVPLVLPIPGQRRPLGQEVRPEYLSLIYMLLEDPGLDVLYQMGIFNFYQQFRLVIPHSSIAHAVFIVLPLERITMLYLLTGNISIRIRILSPAS